MEVLNSTFQNRWREGRMFMGRRPLVRPAQGAALGTELCLFPAAHLYVRGQHFGDVSEELCALFRSH